MVWKCLQVLGRTPKCAAAIDSDWKTRAMLDPQPQSYVKGGSVSSNNSI